jgi:hypothetical protein
VREPSPIPNGDFIIGKSDNGRDSGVAPKPSLPKTDFLSTSGTR